MSVSLSPDERVLSILEAAWQRATPAGHNDAASLAGRRRAAIQRTARDIAYKAGFAGDRAALTALRELLPGWLQDHDSLSDLEPAILRSIRQGENALIAKYGGAASG